VSEKSLTPTLHSDPNGGDGHCDSLQEGPSAVMTMTYIAHPIRYIVFICSEYPIFLDALVKACSA